MTTAKIAIKNYRCFADSNPAIVEVGKGFTAFVGQNNSGKSSLLKLFFELRDLWRLIAPDSSNFIRLLTRAPVGLIVQGVYDQAEIFCDSNNRDIEIEINLGQLFSETPSDLAVTKVRFRHGRSTKQWSADFFVGQAFRDVRNDGKVFKRFAGGNPITADSSAVLDCSVLYEFMQQLTQAIYIGPFRNAINEGTGKYFDLAIGSSFISTWHGWKTGNSKAQNSAITEVTEDIQHIFEFNKLEISASEQLKTLQIVIGNKPYKLPELGAGLAQFIIVLANVMIHRPSFVLIDEPELNLHPSLQTDFLTSLASYATEGVVFATHSIGLARSVAERIYSFQKPSDVSIVKLFEQTPDYVQFLGEMSFSSFKDLGCESVLLVEGVTDVRTTQQFLRKLQKDHKIVVIPLGGDQLVRAEAATELNELTRLGAKVSVLVDREGPDADVIAKRKEFADVACKLGFNVCLTERRAIENYFSDRAIKTVKGEKYRALGVDEKLSECPYGWSKADNWRIAREMQFEEIRDTDIGKFFAAL